MNPTESPTPDAAAERQFLRRAIEASVRIALIAMVALWCFEIVRPFVQPILWGVILAIAMYAPYRKLAQGLGGRRKLAAGLLALVALLVLLGPTVALSKSLVETAAALAHQFNEGTIRVPPPPSGVADWPIIGDQLHQYWSLAASNLEAALQQIAPQLKELGLWMISTAARAGVGIVQFAISIVIAAVFLASARSASATAERILTRLVGDRGAELAEIAGQTVMSVTRGILGVAAMQSLLAGIGFLAVGVPAAGLWTLMVLVVAIVQIPAMIILLPIVLYVFSTHSTPVAAIFTVWSVLVALSDSVLKPLLMGRGVDIPMLVIFLGAIGGFLMNGIIGLFVGAVVLALGYNLFTAWLALEQAAADGPGAQ